MTNICLLDCRGVRAKSLFVLGVVAVSGCWASGQKETAPVRGTVTLDGKAFTQGGMILFQPESSAKMATGLIQSDGSFVLTTYSSGDGATIGKHSAAITPAQKIVRDTDVESASGPISPIPEKYHSPAGSGLAYEVKSGESNRFVIDLRSK
jgi:hypothetical protein